MRSNPTIVSLRKKLYPHFLMPHFSMPRWLYHIGFAYPLVQYGGHLGTCPNIFRYCTVNCIITYNYWYISWNNLLLFKLTKCISIQIDKQCCRQLNLDCRFLHSTHDTITILYKHDTITVTPQYGNPVEIHTVIVNKSVVFTYTLII